ncbi:MAG: hypothetical protein LQ351_007649 [Letrouitia transgressa]|nr:MAG: hypothetical protein LQ351_007649 [Letrouitia transgressa]
MERLYGDYECMVCHRPSAWGWIYSCTQDDKDKPAAAASTVQAASMATVSGMNADIGVLNPWIRNAIAKGSYTAEEISFLIAQRQKVMETIEASEEHFRKVQELEFQRHSFVGAPQFVDANLHLPFPVLGEVSIPIPGSKAMTLPPPKPTIFPSCNYRACQVCRPTYRDRSWQTVEKALHENPYTSTIEFQYPDPPLSDANLVRTLGLRKPKTFRPTLRAYGSSGIYTIDSRGQLVFTTGPLPKATNSRDSWIDVADQKVELESKGFRDSLKRAFRDMLQSKKRNSLSRKHSKRLDWRTEIHEDDSAEFDMGLYRELSEELLQEAVNTSLPGHDGKDGLEGEDVEEIEVGNGVAVTEEAVDLRTADIIMSV